MRSIGHKVARSPDAEQRTQDEGDGDGGAEHGEVVLQPQHAARVPAHVSGTCPVSGLHSPGRRVVDAVHEILLAPGGGPGLHLLLRPRPAAGHGEGGRVLAGREWELLYQERDIYVMMLD